MASGLTFDSNAALVAGAIELHGITSGYKAQGVVRHHGLLLQAEVKRNASKPRTGPPGPRLQTGDYVRSIALQIGLLQADVGTDKPQARRLEFGFTGVDSLGRHYDQPPYAHFGPAVDAIEPLFLTAMFTIATEGW